MVFVVRILWGTVLGSSFFLIACKNELSTKTKSDHGSKSENQEDKNASSEEAFEEDASLSLDVPEDLKDEDDKEAASSDEVVDVKASPAPVEEVGEHISLKCRRTARGIMVPLHMHVRLLKIDSASNEERTVETILNHAVCRSGMRLSLHHLEKGATYRLQVVIEHLRRGIKVFGETEDFSIDESQKDKVINLVLQVVKPDVVIDVRRGFIPSRRFVARPIPMKPREEQKPQVTPPSENNPSNSGE